MNLRKTEKNKKYENRKFINYDVLTKRKDDDNINVRSS